MTSRRGGKFPHKEILGPLNVFLYEYLNSTIAAQSVKDRLIYFTASLRFASIQFALGYERNFPFLLL